MPVITPNFNFAGQRSEAIELYRKAFDAEIACLMRYCDANAQDMSDAWASTEKDWIYHAELLFGGQRIILADHVDLKFEPGLSLSLIVTLDTKADVMRAFEILGEGGSVIIRRTARRIVPVRRTSLTDLDSDGVSWLNGHEDNMFQSKKANPAKGFVFFSCSAHRLPGVMG